jgi:hypothetical protein
VTITAPAATTYLLNATVLASYACADGTGSGIASCVGTVASGLPVDTAVGPHTFGVDATDGVGHVTTTTVNYSVTYNVCLLYDPTKPSNGIVPIRLRLCDAAGQNLSSASLAATATHLDGAPPPPNFVGRTNLGFAFRYDATLGGYVYNLDTRSLSNGTHTMTFTVAGDPVPHVVSFVVKK